MWSITAGEQIPVFKEQFLPMADFMVVNKLMFPLLSAEGWCIYLCWRSFIVNDPCSIVIKNYAVVVVISNTSKQLPNIWNNFIEELLNFPWTHSNHQLWVPGTHYFENLSTSPWVYPSLTHLELFCLPQTNWGSGEFWYCMNLESYKWRGSC